MNSGLSFYCDPPAVTPPLLVPQSAQATDPHEAQEISRLRETPRSLTSRLRSVSAERNSLAREVRVLASEARGLQGELTTLTGRHNEAIVARHEFMEKHDSVLTSLGDLKKGQLQRAGKHAAKIMQVYDHLRTRGVSREAALICKEAMRVRPEFGGWRFPEDPTDPKYPCTSVCT